MQVRVLLGEPAFFELQTPPLFHLYVLRNPEGRLYVGVTSDLSRRLSEHNQGMTRWTSGRGPWRLVYHEEFETRAGALRRERQLKGGRANQELRSRLVEDKGPQSVERVLPGKD